MSRSGLAAHEGLEAELRTAHPLGRIAVPEEPASLVAYLAGDEASFITGAVLATDGGWTARRAVESVLHRRHDRRPQLNHLNPGRLWFVDRSPRQAGGADRFGCQFPASKQAAGHIEL
jgi:hypothetical protein